MPLKHCAPRESNFKTATLQEKKPRMDNSNIEVSASFDSKTSPQVLKKCQEYVNGHCPLGRKCQYIHPDLYDRCKSAEAMEESKIEKLCKPCCLKSMDIDIDLHQYSQTDSQRGCQELDDLNQIKEEQIVVEDLQELNIELVNLKRAQPENETYLENLNIRPIESVNVTVKINNTSTPNAGLVTEETDTAFEDFTIASHKTDDSIKSTENSSSCLKKIKEYSSPLVKNVNDEDIIKICRLYQEWKKCCKKKYKDCLFHRLFNFKPLPFPLRKNFYNNYRNFVGSVTEDNNYYENLVHSTKDDDKGKEIASNLNRYDWIIFVDYENYLSFFDDIKIETSTNSCLIWFCINAVTNSPSKIKPQHFTELKQHVEILVSRAIGSLTNAADNVIFILIHQLDRILSPHVKLAAVSNDKDLHVLKDFKLLNGRFLKILQPQDFTNQLTQFLSKGGDKNEALNLEDSEAHKNCHEILYDNAKSEFEVNESVKILDTSTMPVTEFEFSEKSDSFILYDAFVGSPKKKLKKANRCKHENLIECKRGQVPIKIMNLVLDLYYYHKLGQLVQIFIYSGNKKRFASFEQQFYGGELTVEFKDYDPSKDEK